MMIPADEQFEIQEKKSANIFFVQLDIVSL